MRVPRLRMIVAATIGAAAAFVASPAAAMQYYLLVDVPTTLGGVTYSPGQIVRRTDGIYLLEATFPPGVTLAAILRTPEGKWLLAPAAPVPLDEGALERRTARAVVVVMPAAGGDGVLFLSRP